MVDREFEVPCVNLYVLVANNATDFKFSCEHAHIKIGIARDFHGDLEIVAGTAGDIEVAAIAIFLEGNSNVAEVVCVGAGKMNLDFIFVGARDANSGGAYVHAELAVGREVGCEMILTCFRDDVGLLGESDGRQGREQRNTCNSSSRSCKGICEHRTHLALLCRDTAACGEKFHHWRASNCLASCLGAELSQAARMARRNVVLLAALKATIVHPWRPQAPFAGSKVPGWSAMNTSC